jgi:hypothetical protein
MVAGLVVEMFGMERLRVSVLLASPPPATTQGLARSTGDYFAWPDLRVLSKAR